jgi:DNA-entry nuclease
MLNILKKILLTLLGLALAIFVYANQPANNDNADNQASQAQSSSSEPVPETKPEDQQFIDMQYNGDTVVTINDNITTFGIDPNSPAYINLSDLDEIGRPEVVDAVINKDSLAPNQDTTKREFLKTRPPGFQSIRTGSGQYDWLYNRSHLIGYQLSKINDEPKNLVTGTNQMNADERPDKESMVTIEDQVAYYLRIHPYDAIHYNVDPIYKDGELVPRGLHIQARTINNDNLSLNVYVFNVEDGWYIDYQTGHAHKIENEGPQD